MRQIITLLICTLLFASCQTRKTCPEGEQHIPGTVLKITGPDTLRQGQTVPLVVEVAANDSYCIRRAEGAILQTSNNYVQIGADLIHTGNTKDNDCDCMEQHTVRTIIYFTPSVAGIFAFGTSEPSPLISNGGSDSGIYRVFVK